MTDFYAVGKTMALEMVIKRHLSVANFGQQSQLAKARCLNEKCGLLS